MNKPVFDIAANRMSFRPQVTPCIEAAPCVELSASGRSPQLTPALEVAPPVELSTPCAAFLAIAGRVLSYGRESS